MARLRFRIAISLDGFIAGPDQSVENPLGVGGMRLHAWAFPLEIFRRMHGQTGGEVNASTQVIADAFDGIGATIMGRNMFGGHPGPWSPARPWNGWWGPNPPFHHPVFVVTHHRRERLVLEGGNSFTFVTGGIDAALEQARRAAGGRDVALGGGASVGRQYLVGGLVDELLLSVVPTLLGRGERLLDGAGDDLHGLELVRTIPAPGVVHLVLARR
jgi:dihydrofolate reductase